MPGRPPRPQTKVPTTEPTLPAVPTMDETPPQAVGSTKG